MSVTRGSFQPALLSRLSQVAVRAWTVSQIREAEDESDNLPPPLPCCDFVRPKYHIHPCLRGVLKNHIARKEDEIRALEEAMRTFGIVYSPKNKAQSVIFMKIFQSRKELSTLIDDLEECEANANLERALRESGEAGLQASEE